MRYLKYFLITFAVIVVDQMVKMLVVEYMQYGLPGEIPIFGDWFKLHYTLNPGMAFGLELGLAQGKLVLSLFRLLAMVAIGYYLYFLVKRRAHVGLLVCIALILGGAIGNVIDSTFYGVLLGNAPPYSPTPWFHGQVVDMFYFDIWEGLVPTWMPLLGGQYYSLWPIFNVADASIFVGVTLILLFQKRFFFEPIPAEADAPAPEVSAQNPVSS
ncbi:MAG: lipoprotein signal peptidase [Catalinimonas sp.]